MVLALPIAYRARHACTLSTKRDSRPADAQRRRAFRRTERRIVVAGGGDADRRRSPSRERHELRDARRAAAALRHADDAGAARRSDRAARQTRDLPRRQLPRWRHPERLSQADASALRTLVERHDWIWIAGNHDPILPAMLGGQTVVGEFRLDALVMRHQAEPDTIGEVSGHYHPKSHIDVRGRRLSGACFIHDERRIVLPAFGAYTGGLHIESEPIRALFPAAFRIDLVLRGQLMRREYPIAAA